MVESEGFKYGDGFQIIIPFLSVYILVAGAAYTLGYWALFPINIFDYIGVVDIAKSSVPGLMVSVLMIFSMVVKNVFMNNFNNDSVEVAESKYASFLIKHKRIFVSLFTMMPISLYVPIAFYPRFVVEYANVFDWLLWVFTGLACVVSYIYLISKGYANKLNSRRFMLGATIITMIFVPLASFSIGFGQARQLILGVKYNYVLTSLNESTVNVSELDRYIGYYGGKYFFWEPRSGLVKIDSSVSKLYIKTIGFNSGILK